MGISSKRISRTRSTTLSIVAGSPGPFERNTPSGCNPLISSSVTSKGKTCTSTPRAANALGVAPLIPKSMAATVNFFSPIAGTIYGFSVDTSALKYAPDIASVLRTSITISSREISKSEKMPTRIAPRSRRWRVKARVSIPWIPTMPCSINSTSKSFSLRQLLVIVDGLRTTNPATQIFSDSLSGELTPVFPM